MANDEGFEPTQEQLYKGQNDSVNSDDPYNSDNHRASPKVEVQDANVRSILGVFNRLEVKMSSQEALCEVAEKLGKLGYSTEDKTGRPLYALVLVHTGDEKRDDEFYKILGAINKASFLKDIRGVRRTLKNICDIRGRDSYNLAAGLIYMGLRSPGYESGIYWDQSVRDRAKSRGINLDDAPQI